MVRLKNIFNEKKGSALLLVLVGMMVLYVTSAAFTVMVSNEVKMSRQARNKAKAFYISTAGIENAAAISMRWPHKNKTALEGMVNKDNCDAWFGGGTWGKRFADGCYKVTFTDPPISDAYQPDTTRKIEVEGALLDSSAGIPVAIRARESIYIESPFQRAMWADGSLTFESRLSSLCNCVGWALGNLVVHYYVSGDVYSRRIPFVDFPVGSKCCCRICVPILGCYCLWEPTVGTDWNIDVTGSQNYIQGPDQFNRNRNQIRPNNKGPNCTSSTNYHLHTGIDHRWDADGDGTSGLKPGVDPNKRPLKREDFNDPDDYDLQKSYCSFDPDFDAMPFPKFVAPADPRMPGYSGNLEYITPADAEDRLKINRFLQNVWIDGDLNLDYGWLGGLGKIEITLGGTIFVNGRVKYHSGWFVTELELKSAAGVEPGTVIINKGDLELRATGPVKTNDVNIIMLNGDLKFSSRGNRVEGRGLYYSTRNIEILDHDTFWAGWWAGTSCYGGTLIARDIYFKGNYDHYWNDPNNCPRNENLQLPVGFYNSVRMYNWKWEY